MFSQAENQIFWFESFLERTWNSSAALTVAETLVWFLTVEQQLSTTGNVWFYPDQHKTAHLHWQVQSWLNTNVKHHLIIVMMLPYGLGKWECSVFMHVLVLKKTPFFGRRKAKNETHERRCSVASVSIPDNKVFKHQHDWSFHFFLNSVSIF